jgi:hypothetical protein
MKQETTGTLLLLGLALAGLGYAVVKSIDVEKELDNAFYAARIEKYTGWRILLIIAIGMGMGKVPVSKIFPDIAHSLLATSQTMRMFRLHLPVTMLLFCGLTAFRKSNNWMDDSIVQGLHTRKGRLQSEAALVQYIAERVRMSSRTTQREKMFLSLVIKLAMEDPNLSKPKIVFRTLEGKKTISKITPLFYKMLIKPMLKFASVSSDDIVNRIELASYSDFNGGDLEPAHDLDGPGDMSDVLPADVYDPDDMYPDPYSAYDSMQASYSDDDMYDYDDIGGAVMTQLPRRVPAWYVGPGYYRDAYGRLVWVA